MMSVLDRTAVTRDELHGFYDRYFHVLDNARFEEWLEFFVDDCLYRVIPRENYEVGSGLCLMEGVSKAMLFDRVQVILKTMVFAPRYCRRFYSGLRIVEEKGDVAKVEQNVLVVQTMLNKPSQILGCGVGFDRVVRDASGSLKFAERTLVLDSEMVANSFIYPA